METQLDALLREDGYRWMEPREQAEVWPEINRTLPAEPRPVWLFLSHYARRYGYDFNNGIGVSGQMRAIRAAMAR